MNDLFSRRLDRLQTGLLALSTLLPTLLVVVFIAGRWPDYWKWIASEDTPMTSLEVTVMYTTVLACWLAAGFHYLLGAQGLWRRWFVLGSGFLWLAMDDRFAIHERIRDRILAPADITIPFLPMAPGDFIILLYLLVGLALLPWLIPLFAGKGRAMRHFGAGVLIAAIAVFMDAVDIHRFSLEVERLEQTVEECLELCAQVLFLQGLLLAWLQDVREMPTRSTFRRDV